MTFVAELRLIRAQTGATLYWYLCVSHLVMRPIGFYNSGRLGTELVSLGEMLSGFSIFCYQCLTLLEWHFVISTCPLHPLPGWCDVVAELRLIGAQTGATLYWYLCVSHLVMRPIGFYNPCRLGTELVALVRCYLAFPYSVTSALHS